MSHKELFCELCCSILNTNSNIPKICSFICGEKLNKSNPGLINLKRYLIKRQIWHLADPPTVKKNVTTTEFWKPNTVVKLEIYKQPRAIENNFLFCSKSNLRVAGPLYLSAESVTGCIYFRSNLRNSQWGALSRLHCDANRFSVISKVQETFNQMRIIINFGSTSTIRTLMVTEQPLIS